MKPDYKEYLSNAPLAIDTPDESGHRCATLDPLSSHLPHLSFPQTRNFKLRELTMLSITPIFRLIHRWWLEQAEHHYLICADVEEQRAREAHMNVAYYQKRAALARLARH